MVNNMNNEDDKLKREMMSHMMSDLIGICETPASAQVLADYLIRKGWRKSKENNPFDQRLQEEINRIFNS